MHEAIVLVAAQAKSRRSQVSTKDTDLGLQILKEARKIQVQLQGAPKTQLRFLWIASSHKYVQRGCVSIQQISGNVRADVSGRTGQEYRHVAPSVPVLTASPLAGAS